MSMLKKSITRNGTFNILPKKLLIKNVHVIDNVENLDGTKSVVVQNGKISDIRNNPPATFDGEIIETENVVLMPGLFDMHVHFREPGREDEETLETGSFAAANGGFTGAACMPNTDPAIDSQEVVNFIKEETKESLVDVYPVAAITKAREGKELAPIAEMVEAGAVAISDDGSVIVGVCVGVTLPVPEAYEKGNEAFRRRKRDLADHGILSGYPIL